MNIPATLRAITLPAILLLASFATAVPASAHGGGGGGGHGGGGGGGHGGGFGFHGGGARGFRGGYGYHGGYRGRFGGYGRYGHFGWGGLGYGLFVPMLPYYYSTYWWDGIPYYYADDNYYVWENSTDEYEAVSPPAEVLNHVNAQQPDTDLFAYPRNGQSSEQQAQDKQQCRVWAAEQTGADPATRQGYLRAQAACLEARGYSVK